MATYFRKRNKIFCSDVVEVASYSISRHYQEDDCEGYGYYLGMLAPCG
jgi:hypothetical protein